MSKCKTDRDNKRISEAFNNATRLTIKDTSKIVIMSDCHRGIGDQADNFAGNESIYFSAIRHYFDHNYTYIEIGDGDELWENKKFDYITDEHSHVFWLLSEFYKKNRLHMVYGNHDIVKRKKKWREANLSCYLDERTKKNTPLFKNIDIPEGIILYHKQTGRNLYLLHGHQGELLNDRLWWLARFMVRHLWRPLELIGIKDPTSTAENHSKKETTEKRLSHWAASHDAILIAGHTHRPVFPKTGDVLYFNDGSSVHPRCITALEIENNTISLVKWSANTKKDGTLYIGKSYLEGPVLLKDFFNGTK